jgi:hypothetical protein
MVDTPRGSLEHGRNWFNSRLSDLFRYRTEFRELLRSPKHIDDLEYAIGAGASILDLDLIVISLLGGYSAGKTTLLSWYLPEALPSERSPTSRIYALIEPVEGLTKPEYLIAELGQTGLWRLLRKVAGYLGTFAEGARTTLEIEGGVRAAAAALLEYILRNYDAMRSEKDRINASGAAFLCYSVREFAAETEFVTLRPLSDGVGGFSASEQAAHYVAWDERLQFRGEDAPNGEALRARLASWFRSEPLHHLRLSESAEGERRALTEIYQCGLRLGVIGYLKIRVPANDTLRPGHLYADAPGRGGGSLLDTVMGDLVLEQAAAGVLIANSLFTGGIEQRALEAELRAKSAGVVFNHVDGRIAGDKAVAEATRRLGPDTAEEEFIADTRTIVNDFIKADMLDLYNTESPYRRYLGGSPQQAAKVLFTFGMFGKLRAQTELCQKLTHLAAWLQTDGVKPVELPPHVLRLAERLPNRTLSASITSIDSAIPPKVLARLIGLLVQLGHDGGRSGMAALLQAVEGDSARARFEQWKRCTSEITRALEGVHLPPVAPGGRSGDELDLPREKRQAIRFIRDRVDPAAEATRNRLEGELRIDHLHGPLDLPADAFLLELSERAIEGLATASKRSARGGAIDRFQKVVEGLPARLDLEFDTALEQFIERVQQLLDEIWLPVLDLEKCPDESAKKLLAAAAAGMTVYDTRGEIDTLRRHLHEAFRTHWTEPLQSASPMESIQEERYDPTRHPARFRTIALRIGRYRVATALIQAARAVLASTRGVIEDWLRVVEDRFVQANLIDLARADIDTDPGTLARRRRKEARARFEVIHRECRDVIAAMDETLAPDRVSA